MVGGVCAFSIWSVRDYVIYVRQPNGPRAPPRVAQCYQKLIPSDNVKALELNC